MRPSDEQRRSPHDLPSVSRPLLSLAPALAAAALAGCAAAGPQVNESARTVETRTENRAVEYRFGPVPASWERVRIESNDAAWRDRTSEGIAHIDSSCGRDQDTPLPSLIQQLLIGFTERTFELEETVPFDGREARHVRVLARLDGVPMRMELYVLKKNGCVFDMGFVAPPDTFSLGAAGFDAFARGFRTVNTGGPEALGVRTDTSAGTGTGGGR